LHNIKTKYRAPLKIVYLHAGGVVELLKLLKDSNYLKFKNRYAKPVTDNSTSYLMVIQNSIKWY